MLGGSIALTFGLIWLCIGLFIIAFMNGFWIVIAGLWSNKIAYNESLNELVNSMREMPSEHWKALGLNFPELRIHVENSQPVQFIEDTDLRLDYFQRFMNDSDNYQTAAMRLYGDKTIARSQYSEWIGFLKFKEAIIENSASGNHSYLWRTGKKQWLEQCYLGRSIGLLDLNQIEQEISA